MDIDSFEVSKGPVPLHIKHPTTGKETDIVLHIISPDSAEFKRLTLEEARKNVTPSGEVDVEKLVRRGSEMAASVITGWENIKFKGKPFKYSKANAVKLLEDFTWIADQVEKFLKKRENFFVGSSKA